MTHTEQIKQFIDQLAAGNNAEAKESIENILSAKAVDALETHKKEIAQNIFSGEKTEEPEVQEIEEV